MWSAGRMRTFRSPRPGSARYPKFPQANRCAPCDRHPTARAIVRTAPPRSNEWPGAFQVRPRGADRKQNRSFRPARNARAPKPDTPSSPARRKTERARCRTDSPPCLSLSDLRLKPIAEALDRLVHVFARASVTQPKEFPPVQRIEIDAPRCRDAGLLEHARGRV